jgi:hypothetical protein
MAITSLDGPDPDEIAIELLRLASWCHASGDAEKRDLAVTLAADLMAGEPVTADAEP